MVDIKFHIKLTEDLIQAIYQLRRIQNIDDSYADFDIGKLTSEFRKYYIHLVLIDVEKALFCILSNESFLGDHQSEQEQADDRYITSKILESKIDEFSMWQRKLVEIFIDLIGFKKANKAIYYEHYILVHELSIKKKTKNDRQEYWGCNSSFLNKEIDDLKSRIDNLLKSNTFNVNQWYIKNNKKNMGEEESSFSYRFKEIFPKVKKNQKLIFLSYQSSFGKLSKSVHYKKQYDKEATLQDYKYKLEGISILALYIIVEIKKLVRAHNVKDPLKQLSRCVRENAFPSKIFKIRTNPGYKAGEYVMTPGGLAKIVKVKRVKNKYNTYIVKHLMPTASITDEEYIGDEIILAFDKKTINKIEKKVISIF